MYKSLGIFLLCILTWSCGDFPAYSYDRSNEYCVLSFPFAGGIFDRKYVGYLNITSTLQYLDSNPEMQIFIGKPSHIKLDTASVQKLEIDNKIYIPEFRKNYLQAELQYWGPAFLFDNKQATEIYQSLQEGENITLHGRLAVGKPYETEMYNLFFDDVDQPFRACVNRLLDESDIVKLDKQK